MDIPLSSGVEKTRLFRAAYRGSDVPRRYRGWGHFWLTTVASIAVTFTCIAMLHDVRPWELATVPVAFVYANLAEYLGHKGPMHHRWRLLGPIYLHTTVHHRFYTDQVFGYEKPEDFHALLLPPVFLLFFFGFFAVPIGALLYYWISPNVAYLAIATAVFYFASYEWTHFCYHAPEDSLVLRIGTIRRLRHHHLVHHNPRLMTHYNFNITVPLFDWLFKTTFHDAAGKSTFRRR